MDDLFDFTGFQFEQERTHDTFYASLMLAWVETLVKYGCIRNCFRNVQCEFAIRIECFRPLHFLRIGNLVVPTPFIYIYLFFELQMPVAWDFFFYKCITLRVALFAIRKEHIGNFQFGH